MKVKGTLNKVFDRKHNGRVFYSICVETDGAETWYGTGLNKPDAKEGALIEFEAEKDGKFWKADAGTIKQVSAPRASSGGGGGGWNDPSRQASIVAQSSYDKAIALVRLGIDTEALSLPTKKGEQWGALLSYVAEAAREVAADVERLAGQIVEGTLTSEGQQEDDDYVPLPEDA